MMCVPILSRPTVSNVRALSSAASLYYFPADLWDIAHDTRSRHVCMDALSICVCVYAWEGHCCTGRLAAATPQSPSASNVYMHS